MSLDWGSTYTQTDYLNTVAGNFSVEVSVCAWLHAPTPGASTFPRFFLRESTSATEALGIGIQNGGAATEAGVVARLWSTNDAFAITNNNFFPIGQWAFIAASSDGADQTASTALRMYAGTETSVVAEASSYPTTANGTGTLVDDDTSVEHIGHSSGTDGWAGRIAFVARFDSILTLEHWKAIQFNPVEISQRIPGRVNIWLPGLQGQDFVADLRGRNPRERFPMFRTGTLAQGGNVRFVNRPLGFRGLQPISRVPKLNNKRISSMHFQRFYEPTAMGV